MTTRPPMRTLLVPRLLLLLTFLTSFLPTCCMDSDTATRTVASKTISGVLRTNNDRPVPDMTKLVLNGGQYTSYTMPDGSFAFYKVPPGIHVLDVVSSRLHFGQIKIQILEDDADGESPKCIEYAFPGAPKKVVSHPLVMKAHGTYHYFEKKPGFSIFSIFRNPMILMMIVSGGLMFLMPKMMEGLEPEERERMQKQMEMQRDPSKMLSSLFGMDEQAPAETTSAKRRRIRNE